jgi:hypothetical protein
MEIIHKFYSKINEKNNPIFLKLYHILKLIDIKFINGQYFYNLKKKSIMFNKFISKKIINYTEINLNKNINFKTIINNINVDIHIFYDNITNKLINNIIKTIYYVIYLFDIKLEKKLSIDIYLTDYKKKATSLQPHSLTNDEVNSGFSNLNNNYICIYRKEELYRVLIHELLHIYNPDNINNFKNLKLTNYYIKKYNLSKHTSIDICESIIDFWAIIINSYLFSYNNYQLFLKNIFIEKYFIEKQASHILKISNKHINKNTNVLSYYIIKAEMFAFLQETIKIYITNKINLTNTNFNKNVELLIKKNKKFNLLLNDYDTLRLSIVG